MANIVALDDIKINMKLSFKLRNQYDTSTYICKVTGMVAYNVAKSYSDVLPTYQNVKKTVPDLAPITELTYLVCNRYENGTELTENSKMIAFEWIDQSSIQILDVLAHIDIRVYNVSGKEQAIIDILSDHGYTCDVIKK